MNNRTANLLSCVFLFIGVFSSTAFNQVNTYRAENDLDPMKFDVYSCLIAKERLPEIFTDWSHNGFKNGIKKYPSRIRAGENLAKAFSEDAVVEAWKASPKHNEVLLGDTNGFCIMMAPDSNGVIHYVMESVKRDAKLYESAYLQL